MNKELELEAEKFYPIKTDDLICSPKLVRHAYIVGATSKYVEKQKLEFAIKQLKECQKQSSLPELFYNKIKELEQKLSEI